MSIHKTTNTEYHKIPALSHSLLVKAQISSMDAYLNSAFNPDLEPAKDKDALVYGQLFHALVRLPQLVARRQEYIDKYDEEMKKYAEAKEKKKTLPLPVVQIPYDDGIIYITNFGKSRVNKEYGNVCAMLQAKDDDLVILKDEFERACDEARCLLAHPVYKSMHQGAEVIGDELCIMRELDGYKYKIKMDRLIKRGDNYIIFDWKSTKEKGVRTMQNVGQRLGYDIQNELYKRMVAEEYGVSMENVQMIFFLQCKDMPLTMFAFDFGPESEKQACTERQIAADDFMERLNRGTGLAGFMPVQSGIMRFRHYENQYVDFVPVM